MEGPSQNHLGDSLITINPSRSVFLPTSSTTSPKTMMPMYSATRKRNKKNKKIGNMMRNKVMIPTKWLLSMTKVGSMPMRIPSMPLMSYCPGKIHNMITRSSTIKKHATHWQTRELPEASIPWSSPPTSGPSHDMEDPKQRQRALEKDKKVNSPQPTKPHLQISQRR